MKRALLLFRKLKGASLQRRRWQKSHHIWSSPKCEESSLFSNAFFVFVCRSSWLRKLHPACDSPFSSLIAFLPSLSLPLYTSQETLYIISHTLASFANNDSTFLEVQDKVFYIKFFPFVLCYIHFSTDQNPYFLALILHLPHIAVRTD